MTDDTPTDADGTDREPTAADDAAGAESQGTMPEETESGDRIEESDETDGDDGDGLRHYVERAVLGVLFLFAVVAAFRFYFAASNAVSYWVAARYESAFQAAFNLVVLLIVGAGIVRQLRRMR